ncbi:uncharacterized protein STEHIDRAFT_122315 [Stereum hirsutum FP-91666 SS1]|uniref:uncharacterized protein n=1 Tax=Stereum hirsutum (strain FP-91666) TaxID=721885 RepID=UPI0004449A3E|nr:uncharacterized protein STEHIDRAFT_122315 [Stereum hirsutum FP-91666 SS1]EIM85347.1 hypothetical protein STEHIDRAFT_122315 [Stereum hirsutum FP-91666 SS1]
MTSDSTAPFPALPNELVHHILTINALYSKRACSSITLVSSWARELVLPILWEDVKIDTFDQAEVIQHVASHCKVIAKSREASDDESERRKQNCPLAFVRRLWISTTVANSKFGAGFDNTFFAQCHSLRDITLPSTLLPSLSSLPLLSTPTSVAYASSQSDFRITLLGGGLESPNPSAGFTAATFMHVLNRVPTRPASILSSITHLHLLTYPLLSLFLSESGALLSQMPALTHLTIPFSPSDMCKRAVEVVVREVKQLEVLVCAIRTEEFGRTVESRIGRNGAIWRVAMTPRIVDSVKALRKRVLRTDGMGKRREVVYWASFEPALFEADWTQHGRRDIWSRAMREVQEAEAAEAEEKARVSVVDGDTKGKGKRVWVDGMYNEEATVEVVDVEDGDSEDACTLGAEQRYPELAM